MDIHTASTAALEAWATVRRGRPAEQHRLSDLERVECVVVDGEAGLRRWDALLDAEHCLGVDLVVAWRLLLLAHQGREHPDAPASVYFSNAQWKALWLRTGAG